MQIPHPSLGISGGEGRVWDDELVMMLLPVIEGDPDFRCQLVEVAEMKGYNGNRDADVVDR